MSVSASRTCRSRGPTRYIVPNESGHSCPLSRSATLPRPPMTRLASQWCLYQRSARAPSSRLHVRETRSRLWSCCVSMRSVLASPLATTLSCPASRSASALHHEKLPHAGRHFTRGRVGAVRVVGLVAPQCRAEHAHEAHVPLVDEAMPVRGADDVERSGTQAPGVAAVQILERRISRDDVVRLPVVLVPELAPVTGLTHVEVQREAHPVRHSHIAQRAHPAGVDHYLPAPCPAVFDGPNVHCRLPPKSDCNAHSVCSLVRMADSRVNRKALLRARRESPNRTSNLRGGGSRTAADPHADTAQSRPGPGPTAGPQAISFRASIRSV